MNSQYDTVFYYRRFPKDYNLNINIWIMFLKEIEDEGKGDNYKFMYDCS